MEHIPHKCQHCKVETKDVIKVSRQKRGNKIIIYYMCNPCNTDRLRKYRMTANGKKNVQKAVKKYESKHKRAREAWTKVNIAVICHKIKKPTKCEKCGKEELLHGHHKDYSKPLQVIWLCSRCHRKEHREMVK